MMFQEDTYEQSGDDEKIMIMRSLKDRLKIEKNKQLATAQNKYRVASHTFICIDCEANYITTATDK